MLELTREGEATVASWHQDFFVNDRRVSPKLNRISKGGEAITIKHKSMAVLVSLADAEGELVTRNEIMNGVWPNMEVTDDVLTQSVVELRKAFDDDAKHPRFIETIPRVGFRLIAKIKLVESKGSTVLPESVAVRVSRRSFLTTVAIVFVAVIASTVIEWPTTKRNPVITVSEPPSIAVLPFVNVSDDPENEYFSEGMSDEIRNLLGRIPDLKVIGRTSSHVFKGQNEDLRVIGQRLGISNVLEGSVRESEGRVRVTLQLIDTSDGAQKWSDSYDREMTDIFAVYDDIANDVIDALQIHVGVIPTRGRPTEMPDAYALFLKARAALNVFEFRNAEELLLQAIDLDPEFAEAFEYLAYTYWMMAGTSIDAVESQRLVREASTNAIVLDPSLVFARIYARATKLGPDYRWGTIAALDEAIREQPDDPRILEALVFLLVETGYLKEALQLAEHYVDVDPLSLIAQSYLAASLYSVGRNHEALQVAEFALRSTPNVNGATWNIVGMLLRNREDDIAVNYVETFLQQHGYPNEAWFRDIVTNSRDPARGQAYIDRRIPQIVAAMPEQNLVNWYEELLSLYLYFNYLDRHYELVLATEPTDTTWHYAGIHVWRGTVFRQYGYTGHPDYLEIARLLSIDDVWERRGAPDFCEELDGQWVCK